MKHSALPAVGVQPVDFARRYTYDELCAAVGETNQPHELWDGLLVMEAAPGYGHQQIVGRLYRALSTFVESRKLGEVVLSPIDMLLAPNLCLQPDLVYISKNNPVSVKRAIEGPADLAVEVVSPWQRSNERGRKRRVYERFGITEYWIIDPQLRTVEVLALSAKRKYQILARYADGDTAMSGLLAGFEIRVTALFGGQCP